MKSATIALSIPAITELFNSADWTYTYNMQRVNEEGMADILFELETASYSEKEIEAQIGCIDETDMSAFGNQTETDNINIYVGWLIADRVAQAKVCCSYESVTFSALFKNN